MSDGGFAAVARQRDCCRALNIGDGNNPSFPTVGAAFSAFFHGNFTVTGTSNPELGQLSVRLVDGRARVRIRPTLLDVWVGGRALAGAQLELNGAAHRASVELTKGGRVSCPFRQGCRRTHGCG